MDKGVPEEPRESTLSEYGSKKILTTFGIPTVREELVLRPSGVPGASQKVGFPCVIKLCGEKIAHKSERNLVRLGVQDVRTAAKVAEELWELRRAEDGEVGLLVAHMVGGRRELIAGMVRDAQFGACILLGLGGIFTEAIGDVSFAVAPVSKRQAEAMILGLASREFLTKTFRGEPPVDGDTLADILVALGRLAQERPEIESVDINPLIVADGIPIAVDALVVLRNKSAPARPFPSTSPVAIIKRFQPLFEPRGVIVAGASTHPGKFGFVSLHNLRRYGYRGEVFPVNREGAEILGEPTYKRVEDIPPGKADLVFVCTPTTVNEELLRSCAKIGVKAAFVASGGYRESGEDGLLLEKRLVSAADELGILLAGPNGQGLISTSLSMCAQIVAPYPPSGSISIVSQSGNLLSAFLNYSVETGVGVEKAISSGNSAQTSIADYFDYFAADPRTKVVLSYMEGIPDGPKFIRSVQRLTAVKPLVLVKGGVAVQGQQAALSHTGSLASDDKVFNGLCKQHGVLRASTIEEAFEWAATLATQPLPRGDRVVVFTTVGGWGVLTADACAGAGLDLIRLPSDLQARIDKMVPARWSRNNPIDLAGGETRDTVPEILDLVCGHSEVDAVLHLGLGIQSATAQTLATGEYYPDYGLDRMTAFHQKQDARYARAAADASVRHGKPVLSATELVHTARAYENSATATIRQAGRVCYPSAHRAVSALCACLEYARHLSGGGLGDGPSKL